jgi:hypothetical protein
MLALHCEYPSEMLPISVVGSNKHARNALEGTLLCMVTSLMKEKNQSYNQRRRIVLIKEHLILREGLASNSSYVYPDIQHSQRSRRN